MDVYNHYQDLLEMFAKCGGNSAFKIPIPRVTLTKKNLPSGIWSELELQGGYLSLKTDIGAGNPNGFADKWELADGELEILIYPREGIRSNDPWNIKWSQIEIAYLYSNYTDDKIVLLLSLHFDYSVKDEVDEPADAHPIFHVSLTDSPMKLRATLNQRNVDTTRMKGVPIVRLPTAHMTLPSVLLNVAADHFQPAEFAKFLRYMRGEASYPAMVNAFFKKRMDEGKNRMRSCAWYADLPAVAV